MTLLKQLDIDTTIPNLPGQHYTISPGAIAVSATRIYIPGTSATYKTARMLVYDYEGQRQSNEEYDISYTRGTILGGATYYNNEVWVVTDEQVEDKFIGCVRRYAEGGERGSGIGLPWVYANKLFKPLGITVEQNLFYILTQRTGWLQGKELTNKYQVERYDPTGKYQGSHNLSPQNNTPVGLTDNESLFFTTNTNNNQTYAYTHLFANSDKGFGLDTTNIKAGGIGYNGAAFCVLRVFDSNNVYAPKVFIYGDTKIKPDPGDPGETPLTPADHSASIVTEKYKQYNLRPKYVEKYDVVRLHANDIDFNIITQDEIMIASTSVEYLTATDFDNKLFQSLDFYTFLPKYTLPGLRIGDILVQITTPGTLPTTRFQIVGFIERLNGHFQRIVCQRIG